MNDERPSGAPRLENRLPAEGINSSDEHPLKEMAWLVAASLVTLAVVVLLVGWGARWLAPYVPFRAEQAIAERVVDKPPVPADTARVAALQAVADRVSRHMGLPDGMSVLLAYDERPVVNAYATIGGRIVVFAGLLRELHSEDALAALLAHEIAHVQHRHVAASMGRGLALALLLGVISSDAGAAAAQSALGQAAGLAMLGYSREQETQADEDALRALVAQYGHGAGVVELFKQLGRQAGSEGPQFEVLRSHPLTPARLRAIQEQAGQAGWATQGTLTPLPEALRLPPAKH